MSHKNPTCYFVSDLHGKISRYQTLFAFIKDNPPNVLFLGGDLLPSPFDTTWCTQVHCEDFIGEYLHNQLASLRTTLGNNYPQIYTILGNDDGRFAEASILALATHGLWEYIHNRSVSFQDYRIFGYNFVPPTPFMLKDWERYDVSRYVDPGCIPIEEGKHSFPTSETELRYATIKNDLNMLSKNHELSKSIFLFHSPPYQTKLDRAALDGKMVDYVPLDVNIGSIAISRFIEEHQPMLTLHGHVHESTRLTGSWKDTIKNCTMFNAAHDGTQLALITFELQNLDQAQRLLL